MIARQQLLEDRVRDTRGHHLCAVQRCDLIACLTQNESGYFDRTEHVAYVDLHERLPEVLGHRRAGPVPLCLAEEFAYSVDLGDRTEEQVGQGTLAPPFVDLGHLGLDLGTGEPPRERWRVTRKPWRGPEQHEGTNPLGIGRGEEDTHRSPL